MASINQQLAAIFQQMADLTEITGGNGFKVNAFAKVARVLDELPRDVGSIDRAALPKLKGIGKGAAERIGEYLDTGEIADHRRLMESVPPGLLHLMDVPGLGPKTTALLWKEGGVESVESLKAKLETGELTKLKGFGAKKIENLKKNLAFAETAGRRTRLGKAWALAQVMVERLRDVEGVERVEYAGSLRRGRETIGDLDLLVSASSDAPEAAKRVFDVFVGQDLVADVLLRGETKASIRTVEEVGGMQADLRVVTPEQFGAAWMYFTGSKDHNVKLRERAIERGMSLNEYALTRESDGAWVAGETEEEVYAALGLAWVPPELREGRGEVALAEHNEVPRLIELGDVKAELHAHTTASDGRWSIEELALNAAERGFHTVAVTDHSKGQAQANGLSAERLIKHIAAVRAVAERLKGTIRVLAGSEVDILADGRLDYPDELLAELDLVVASPHAALSQDPATATKRLIRAIENPYVTIIGHPTGRLIARREGLSPDIDAVCRAAAARGVALEINASYYRLDLRDTHARAAVYDHGCKLSINTDAHGPGDGDNLRFGVMTARRAGVRAGDVVNCFDAAALAAWIASTRRR